MNVDGSGGAIFVLQISFILLYLLDLADFYVFNFCASNNRSRDSLSDDTWDLEEYTALSGRGLEEDRMIVDLPHKNFVFDTSHLFPPIFDDFDNCQCHGSDELKCFHTGTELTHDQCLICTYAEIHIPNLCCSASTVTDVDVLPVQQ